MQYTSVTNLQWAHDNAGVDCIVNFVELGEVPFTATPLDSLEYGKEIYARCIAGDFGPIADYVPVDDTVVLEPGSLSPSQQIPVTNAGSGQVL